MRALVWLLSAWLALSPALADSAYVAPTATGQAATGQIPGTATNDSASAGKVGELLTSTCPSGNATVTITIASPGVITYTAHGLSNVAPASDVCPIVFTNSGGALPTGITSGTTYWTVPSSYTTDTFQIATSAANAIAGTSVNTSGSQSGTQTGTRGSALATNIAITTAARAITAGDWDIECTVQFASASTTIVNTIINSLSTTDNTTSSAIGTRTVITWGVTAVASGTRSSTIATPFVPVSLASTTNYYCASVSEFTTSTSTAASSVLTARRRR